MKRVAVLCFIEHQRPLGLAIGAIVYFVSPVGSLTVCHSNLAVAIGQKSGVAHWRFGNEFRRTIFQIDSICLAHRIGRTGPDVAKAGNQGMLRVVRQRGNQMGDHVSPADATAVQLPVVRAVGAGDE